MELKVCTFESFIPLQIALHIKRRGNVPQEDNAFRSKGKALKNAKITALQLQHLDLLICCFLDYHFVV